MPDPAQLAPEKTVRIIHGALLVGAVFILGALWVAFRDGIVIEALRGPAGIGALAACGAGFAFGVWWRFRIPSRSRGQSELDYWQQVMPRALALWALLEGVTIVAGLLAVLSARSASLALIGGLYLVMMVAFRPSALAGE